jgi:hypothetical protein
VTDNWLFVGAAFVVTWAVLIGYFLHVHRALRSARALVDDARTVGMR